MHCQRHLLTTCRIVVVGIAMIIVAVIAISVIETVVTLTQSG